MTLAVCEATLKLPFHLLPLPFGPRLACAEQDVSCIADLKEITTGAGGVVGRRVVGRGSTLLKALDLFATAPVPGSCLTAQQQFPFAHASPCVSAPVAAILPSSTCALTVFAGCGEGGGGGEADPWGNVGCGMHGGSQVRFQGANDSRLDGDWLVAPDREDGQPGSAFSVYRADGQPHGLEAGEPARAAAVLCLLEPVLTEGTRFPVYSYPSCLARSAVTTASPPPPSQALLLTLGSSGAAAVGLVFFATIVLFLRRTKRRGAPLLPTSPPSLEDAALHAPLRQPSLASAQDGVLDAALHAPLPPSSRSSLQEATPPLHVALQRPQLQRASVGNAALQPTKPPPASRWEVGDASNSAPAPAAALEISTHRRSKSPRRVTFGVSVDLAVQQRSKSPLPPWDVMFVEGEQAASETEGEISASSLFETNPL